MKKGFTLIELLAVIIVLGIIAIITIPTVNDSIKYAKEEAYKANIDAIKKAASDWSLQNAKLLPDDNESIIVYLGELKHSGIVDMNLKNPATGYVLSNNTSVTITNNGGKFSYRVNLIEVNENSHDAPLLVIEGDVVDYVEVTQDDVEYVIPTAYAKDESGNSINAEINYQIFKDDIEVSSVNTNALGIYTIIYSVTYQGETGSYQKKVIVKDTTKPEIDFGDNIICSTGNIPSGNDLLTGVVVTDNSGETITPVVDSKVQNETGIYYVYYTATDSSGNSETIRREVVVN